MTGFHIKTPEVLKYRLHSFPLDLLELLSATDSARISLFHIITTCYPGQTTLFTIILISTETIS